MRGRPFALPDRASGHSPQASAPPSPKAAVLY